MVFGNGKRELKMINELELKGKSILQISHSDLDGIMSIVVGKYYLEPLCNFSYQVFSDKDFTGIDWAAIEKADSIIFTDLAPTEEMCIRLNELNKSVMVFDHHATSNKYLTSLCGEYHFDLLRCGTKIFYDYITDGMRKNRVLDRMVELTNTYDLWQDESPSWQEAKDFSTSLYSHIDWKRVLYSAFPPTETEKHEKFIGVSLTKIDKAKEFFFTGFELQKIQEAKEKEKVQYEDCKQKIQFRIDDQGNKYAFISASAKVSNIANRFLKEYKDKIDYIVVWNTFEKNSKHMSIRSNGEFDTTQISEIWEGGGHKAASAFNFKDNDKFNDFLSGKIHLL
jgi:oligoribonuclease NrnB/cAMP/cGMP phosphodiesterase (DHH superfamily)